MQLTLTQMMMIQMWVKKDMSFRKMVLMRVQKDMTWRKTFHLSMHLWQLITCQTLRSTHAIKSWHLQAKPRAWILKLPLSTTCSNPWPFKRLTTMKIQSSKPSGMLPFRKSSRTWTTMECGARSSDQWFQVADVASSPSGYSRSRGMACSRPDLLHADTARSWVSTLPKICARDEWHYLAYLASHNDCMEVRCNYCGHQNSLSSWRPQWGDLHELAWWHGRVQWQMSSSTQGTLWFSAGNATVVEEVHRDSQEHQVQGRFFWPLPNDQVFEQWNSFCFHLCWW